MKRRSLIGMLMGTMLLVGGCGRFDFEEKPIEQQDKTPTLSYPASLHALVNKTALDVMPVATGEDLSFSVSPSLPAGITLDEATGKISGTPTANIDRGDYLVTATNAYGSASALIFLTALSGEVADVMKDGSDVNDGMDAMCQSTDAGGCSFRAAYETANHLQGNTQLVLLPPGTYKLKQAIGGLKKKIVIAGAGADKTFIELEDASVGGGHSMFFIDNELGLRVENLTIRGFDGGALVASKGTLDVFGVTFEKNKCSKGAAISVYGGAVVTVEHSTFLDNKAVDGDGWGGAINAADAGTQVTVRRSTATKNTAKWGSFSHIVLGAQLTLESSTIYNNHAIEAGALASPSGRYTVRDSTIAGNTVLSSTSAGIYLDSAAASYTLSNSIIAENKSSNNEASNCFRKVAGGGEVKSFGGNVFGDGGGNCGGLLTETDVMNGNVKLDPAGLANHGGFTQTLAILPGSAAIDVATSCAKEDQRGAVRGEPCDAGAFELK